MSCGRSELSRCVCSTTRASICMLCALVTRTYGHTLLFDGFLRSVGHQESQALATGTADAVCEVLLVMVFGDKLQKLVRTEMLLNHVEVGGTSGLVAQSESPILRLSLLQLACHHSERLHEFRSLHIVQIELFCLNCELFA